MNDDEITIVVTSEEADALLGVVFGIPLVDIRDGFTTAFFVELYGALRKEGSWSSRNTDSDVRIPKLPDIIFSSGITLSNGTTWSGSIVVTTTVD